MKRTLNIIAITATTIMLWACNNNQNDTQRIFSSVHDLNELQVASATVSKIYTVRDPYFDDKENPNSKPDFIERLERSLHIIEHSVKIGDRIGIYGINCNYVAVINLNDLAESDIITTHSKGVKQVSITLPPVKVRAVGNEFETKVYHERTSGLRSAITENERATMRRQAAEKLNMDIQQRRNADLEELQAAGEKKAKEFFTTMLQNMGYSPVITFKKTSN
ncbi:MAG: DUF4230 domain-containing protein [Muribaculaceae bacterium]